MSEKSGISSAGPGNAIDVSIVMPCLDEARALPAAIATAQAALALLRQRHGLVGEILIADNGSTDASREIAERLGARVVPVAERGYGTALMGGFAAARGRYLVMGDADGSYDFRDAVAMVESLRAGADLCLGSRFRGAIARGAMPWKNRYIGNPVLTGILNLLFRAGVSDAHCGIRALTKGCLKRLRLNGTGMEFASEMIIKAALKGERIAEVPARLSPDLRGRPPHLRPWRDGWRHLRFLLMLSPAWLFALPALLLAGGGLALLILAALTRGAAPGFIGNYWIILAGAMLGLGHNAALLAVAAQLYGVREGYRTAGRGLARLSRIVSLETMLAAGLAAVLAGLTLLGLVVGYWSLQGFGPIGSVLPAVLGTSLLVIGTQNALGGFLLAVLNGNEAAFLRRPSEPRREPAAIAAEEAGSDAQRPAA
ncbi:glycosyltransferase family 2 protein [Methylobacterium sp. ID0610]|uniref:glycosyltransferase family 2 protein n=1 Tax=Methylobacterium carpenticola TaxID=3344827 RepID=UPI003678EC4B